MATSRFACDDRERALFEAGIKMGTIYHQFVGTPVNSSTVADLEKAMSETIEVQPFVESARISICRGCLSSASDEYSYASLTGDMIDAIVVIKVGDSRVTAEMRYDKELNYPLMFVSGIERCWLCFRN